MTSFGSLMPLSKLSFFVVFTFSTKSDRSVVQAMAWHITSACRSARLTMAPSAAQCPATAPGGTTAASGPTSTGYMAAACLSSWESTGGLGGTICRHPQWRCALPCSFSGLTPPVTATSVDDVWWRSCWQWWQSCRSVGMSLGSSWVKTFHTFFRSSWVGSRSTWILRESGVGLNKSITNSSYHIEK